MNWLQVSTSVVFVSTLCSPILSRPCEAGGPQAQTQTSAPPNILVAGVLVPVVDALLAASPMFTAQCERIAMARYVRVVVNPVMASSTTSRGTARATMRRFSGGALVVAVEMPVPLTMPEYAELFGHEFEHIVEQIDRVNLEALTLTRGGATRLADGAYETTRARRAGQAIAAEAERSRPIGITPPTDSQPPITRLFGASSGRR